MPFLLLLIVWFCWGLSYPMTAVALTGFDPMTLRCFVQLVGCGGLLTEILLSRRPLAIERDAWWDLTISGILNMGVFPVGLVLGVYLMSPGRTSVIVYTMPIWAALFAWIMLGERLTPKRVAALLLGASAVVALMSQDLSNLRNAPVGAAATLVAALSFGLGTVYLKRRRWRADPSTVAWWQILIGATPILLVWLAIDFPPDLSRAGWSQWLALLFLGVMSNGFAYYAWFRLVRLLPASVSSISCLAIPCIGVSTSILVTHERFHTADLAAFALIGAALVLVLIEQWRPSAARARKV